MFHVMRIIDEDGNVFWMDGHDEDEARYSFGHAIIIVKMVATSMEDV